MKADIALIGLAVMGENLVMNIQSKGFTVAVYNRTTEKVDRFVSGRAKGLNVIGCHTLTQLRDCLSRPRKVMLMVKSGQPVDDYIEQLLAVLEPGDIIIDGGNSHYVDTQRRVSYVESKGLYYIGTGVSGGEEGALHGPSLMPGGSAEAWETVRPIFEAICAKANDGAPCCSWIGSGGAGHFVKMVHNGIEYGDMQLICEAYQLMRDCLGLTAEQMHEVFAHWNTTELDSYLIAITRDILAHTASNGERTLEHILDTAGQKGTGKWTGIAALNEGVPLTLIAEAVFSRCLSAQKAERVAAAALYPRNIPPFTGDRDAFIEDIRQALYAAKIISYTQGFALMHTAAASNGWQIDFGAVAAMWRGGCIIRSAFLGQIQNAFRRDATLCNLLMDDFFASTIRRLLPAWRRVVAHGVSAGVPIPAISSALSYFDGYTTERLPANLLQAQRDYFGAHGYERLDGPRGHFFHTDWTGHGGNTASTTYNA